MALATSLMEVREMLDYILRATPRPEDLRKAIWIVIRYTLGRDDVPQDPVETLIQFQLESSVAIDQVFIAARQIKTAIETIIANT
jgi:hypothetical protein